MRYRQIAMPIELTQIIPEDDSVRLIDEIIEEISNEVKYNWNSNHQNTARIMMKIIIYGLMERTTSLRDIEKSCKRDINFKWLLQNETAPSKSTIGRFIQKNTSAIEGVFYYLVDLLNNRNEMDNKTVYVDGTKIEAYANKYTFVWKKAVNKHEKSLDEKIADFMNQINSEYTVSFKPYQIKWCLDYLKQKIESNRVQLVYGKGKRKTQIQRQYEQLQEHYERKSKYIDYNSKFNGRNSFSKTDIDATFMHMKEDHMRNSQLKPGYNVQIAVNSEYIVGLDVSSERSDKLTLIPLLDKLERKAPIKFESVTADAGYESEENYSYLDTHNITSYIKPQNYERSKKKSNKKYIGRLENMEYDKSSDEYICTNGQRLKFSYMKTRKSKSGFESEIKVYECESCDNCPYKSQCTKSQYNKQLHIAVKFHEFRKESLANITSDVGIIFRINRSIQVEGAFGVLKEDYGFRRLLRRGMNGVKTEFTLRCIAYNINKLWNKKRKDTCGFHLHMPRAG